MRRTTIDRFFRAVLFTLLAAFSLLASQTASLGQAALPKLLLSVARY